MDPRASPHLIEAGPPSRPLAPLMPASRYSSTTSQPRRSAIWRRGIERAARKAAMTKRAATYVRVSTDKQTVENQTRELRS